MAEKTFENRINELSITTPDGAVYESLQYQDVEIEYNKKTSAYDFGEMDKQLIQDFGLGSVSVPLMIFFSGPQYDSEAKAFIKSVIKNGVCELIHPVYGRLNVIISKIQRRDALRSGRGQAIVTLEISETITPNIPASGALNKSEILGDMADFAITNSEIFSEIFDAEIVSDQLSAIDRALAFIAELKSAFQKILSTVSDIQQAFDNLEKNLISNIDFFMTAPIQFATQIQRLVSTPARLANKVKDRMQLYRDLYQNTFTEPTGNGKDKKNQLAEKQLQQTAILSAIAESALFPENEPDADKDNGDFLGFLTQADAINSAIDIANDYAAIQEFLDQQQKSDESNDLENRYIVSDEVTAGLKNIASKTSKNLVRLSFSLKKEKIMEVQSDTNIINLCFDLYGSTQPDILDFFLQTNELTGEDILQINKGTMIKSYA